jgi:hypothetical protein
MTEETSMYCRAYLAALLVGGVGAVGQAALLWHELVNTYPYKMMSFPSGDFYAGIGDTGLLAAPILAVITLSLLRPRRLWLVPALPVVLCPAFFWCVYRAAFLLRELRGNVEAGRNFDGTTPAMVEQAFVYYASSLSLAGLGIGLACGAVLWLVFRPKRPT